MKIGVLGAGAVGGYFGARLAQAGNDVTFIGTQRTVDALRENGLLIKSYKGDFEIKKPKVFHSFENIQDVDVILFCVKAYHTKQIAEALKPRISSKTVIVSMQNGIQNETLLADIFGKERVVGSVVFISSMLEKPGVINHLGFGKITMGELSGQRTKRVEALEKMFIKAGVPAGITTDIDRELWKKLILNIAYNGLTALIKDTLEGFNDVAEMKEVFYKILKEGQAVALKEGHHIQDSDIDDLMKVTTADAFLKFKTSTLQDVLRGRALEIDEMQGVIVKLAKKHNIQTPMNELIYALLKLQESKKS